jgi:hypothetical protein
MTGHFWERKSPLLVICLQQQQWQVHLVQHCGICFSCSWLHFSLLQRKACSFSAAGSAD